MPKTRSRRRHGGCPTTPRRCRHCDAPYLHKSPVRYCPACRPLVRDCCECGERCVPVYSLSPQTRRTAGRCQRCHDNPLIHQPPDHAPPPSVDPGRPDRLKKYADRAALGLPLFD